MRKPRKWVEVTILLTLVLSLLYFLYNVYVKVHDSFIYMNQRKENAEIIEQLKEQEKALQKEKEKLENPDYILRYARGKYLLSKDGETIIRLPSKEK